MTREVRARIGAARLLLETIADKAAHEAASQTQRIALIEVIKRSSLTVGELAELSELALGVAWAGDDSRHVAAALVPSSKGMRRNMQDYQNLHEFFVQSEWDAIMHASATLASRLEVILSRAMKLGCRCPSEHTLQHMTSLLLVLCEPADRLSFLTAAQKSDMMAHVRADFKRWARRADKPVEHLEKLPATMKTLRELFPSMVEHAYLPGEAPVACVIDIKLVHSLSASYRCRGGNLPAPSAMVPTLQLGGQGQQQGFGQLERFAMMMMDNMTRLQASHYQLHSCLQGSGGSSLASLAQRSGFMNGNLPNALQQSAAATAAVLGQPQVAAPVFPCTMPLLAPTTALLAVTPRPDPCPRVEEVVGEDAALDGEELEQLAKEVHVSEDAIASTSRLLELIDDRDAEKRAMGKAKAKGKSKGKTAAKGSVGKLMLPSAATGKGKGKLTAKNKGKDKAAHHSDKVGKRPGYTVERSRNQVLCRTGLGGPNSTLKFAYGPKHATCKTEAAAITLAKKWVADELKRQGWAFASCRG